MKVKAKIDDEYLIKDEWYEVIKVSKSNRYAEGSYYRLKNINLKRWDTNWFESEDFYTLEEIRDQKLNEILNES